MKREIYSTPFIWATATVAVLCSIALAAIFSNYPGIIEIKFKGEHNSGEIRIDGRTLLPPQLDTDVDSQIEEIDGVD